MFRPTPMVRIDLLVLQRDLPGILQSLAGASLLHLRPVERALSGDGADLSGILERCRSLEERLERLKKGCGPGLSFGAGHGELDLQGWESWSAALEKRLRGLEKRLKQWKEREQHFRRLEVAFGALSGTGAECEALQRLKFSRLWIGVLPPEALLDWPEGMGRLWSLGTDEGGVVAALLIPLSHQQEAQDELLRRSGAPVMLPRTMKGTFRDIHQRLHRLGEKARRHRERLEWRSRRIRNENAAAVSARLATVRSERHLLEVRDTLGFTERTVVLEGWIPRRRRRELRRLLQRQCGDRHVLQTRVARGDDTPVLLSNPALLRPFERLLALYGTPRYGELEPTPLLAIGFLLLFGVMFGDVGHGLVLLAVGLLLRRFSRFRDQGLIVAEVGASAACFGILFGSVFGREDLLPALWFSPMEEIDRTMLAALSLGAALILIGLVLRVINGLRQGDLLPVLTDRYGFAGLLFYGGAILLGALLYRDILCPAMLYWLLLPLAAVFFHPFAVNSGTLRGRVGFLAAEGLVEMLETLLGFLTNTFSFLRVAAFGLAHVGLFMALFTMAEAVRDLPLGWVWAALVHVVGNALILLLEGLVVSVQAVRLEFYEFFSKFFQGGGIDFHPLSLNPDSRSGG